MAFTTRAQNQLTNWRRKKEINKKDLCSICWQKYKTRSLLACGLCKDSIEKRVYRKFWLIAWCQIQSYKWKIAKSDLLINSLLCWIIHVLHTQNVKFIVVATHCQYIVQEYTDNHSTTTGQFSLSITLGSKNKIVGFLFVKCYTHTVSSIVAYWPKINVHGCFYYYHGFFRIIYFDSSHRNMCVQIIPT